MRNNFNDCLKESAYKPSLTNERHLADDGDKPLFGICDDFLLDFSKIIQSKSFRRLKSKTQVFCFPDNPHVRSRMTHTLEVTAINCLISDVLGLNTNLVKACSIGHDVGHVPFGHVGERFLSKYTSTKFEHNIFGPIVMQMVERGGRGLNLMKETLEGIKRHSGANFEVQEEVEEYKIVKLGDKISYTFSDPNDAVRFNYVTESEFPNCIKVLGANQRERINTCLFALFKESCEKGTVSFSESETAKMYHEVRDWMFENVYSRANTRIINEELTLAFEAILEYSELKEYDPVVIFSALTESGVREIAQKGLSRERFYYLGIEEIVKHLKKGIKYYNSPD